jgi:TRAP-type C4-dicarboxylate transport system substrate-binding protein
MEVSSRTGHPTPSRGGSTHERTLASLAAALFVLVSGPASAQIALRMGHDQPVGSMYDEGHNMFKKLVEARSGGRIKASVFPAA